MGVPERATWQRTDPELVQACLAGGDEAWSELVAKYTNLVYSIALRQNIREDDASDLFQSVWTQVYLKLPSLRQRDSIRSWLIRITTNQCYHWRQRDLLRQRRETPHLKTENDRRLAVDPVDLILRERRLTVQQAIGELTPRHQELIRLLFYHQPPLPYRQVAARLGVAVGSIGFMRGLCLKRLCRLLEQRQARPRSATAQALRRAGSPRRRP